MDCSEFNRLLDNYENLSDNERNDMNNHAQNCENCKSELEFYKSIILTAASLPVPEPPADLIERVNSRIDAMPRYRSGFDKVINNLRRNTSRYASAAACIAVGVIVGLNSGRISNMLDPRNGDGQTISVVDVADSGTEPQNGDNAPAVNDETDLTEAAPVLPDAGSTVSGVDPVLPEARPAAAKSKSASNTGADAAVSTPKVSTVKQNTNGAKSSAATVEEPVKATEISEPVSETAKVVQEPVTITQAPSNKKTSKYTIARENYHIPVTSDEADAAPKATENNAADTAPSERYQIAMGNYEISEEEKKSIKNKLIVRESDIAEITACMNKAGIRGASDGCEASISAFNNFLSMLNAKGIYYSYAEASSSGSTVSFVLLAN